MKIKRPDPGPNLGLVTLMFLSFLLGGNAIQARQEPDAAPTSSETSLELMFLDEENLVVTATKRLQKLTEVPGSVTIITEQDIKEKGCLTLKECFANFTAAEFAYEGLFAVMRFRGIQSPYNNKILVLLNGRKINTVDWNNYALHFGFNLDNIKQIEIIKGPGSPLYGANAFAGVINIITKQGIDLNGLNLKLSPGYNFEAEELSQYYLLSYGKKSGDTDYMVSTSYWRQWDIDVINRNTPNNLYQGQRIDLSLSHQQALTLHGGYHKMEYPYPGYFYIPTPRNKNFQETAYLDANYTLTLDELSQLSFRAGDTYYPRRFLRQVNSIFNPVKIDSPADLPPGLTGIYYEDGTLSAPPENAIGGFYIDIASLDGSEAVKLSGGSLNEFLAEIQYDLAWPGNNYLILGLSFTYDWSHSNYFTTDIISEYNYAVYLQDEYHLRDNLILLGGVRYDFNTQYGGSLSPRGSLIYSLLPNLRWKTLYGRAFRSPAMIELHSQEDYGIYKVQGNAGLAPEKIEQSEALIEYEMGKWLQVKGGYFYWETREEIQPTILSSPFYLFFSDMSLVDPALPATPGLYQPLALHSIPTCLTWNKSSNRIAHGLELETALRFSSYFKLKLNYAGFRMYSRGVPRHPTWGEGFASIFNGQLGFNYENIFFANFYAHLGRSPNLVKAHMHTSQVDLSWLSQYDLSLGGKYQGMGLTFTIFNLFENYIAFDSYNNQRIAGGRIIRLNADYTFNF